MTIKTSSPQPQAVERKDKSPSDGKVSNLAGSEHNKSNQEKMTKPKKK